MTTSPHSQFEEMLSHHDADFEGGGRKIKNKILENKILLILNKKMSFMKMGNE